MTTFADLIDEAADAAPALRAILDATLAEVPDAVEGTSYGVPALFHAGKPLLGLARTAKGFSLYPFSGELLAQLPADLTDYRVSTGALGFDATHVPPVALVLQIVRARRDQIDRKQR